ncbi:MAG: hypothetical protein HZB53_19645 [Chloroflexi bacterium]|nr:hypothetical protein [Chloroflexota bacterium]
MSSSQHSPEAALSRRELLKKLGAAGAILGARAIVPTNWAQPEVETGNLPVHAQTSGPGTVTGEIWVGPFNPQPPTRQAPANGNSFTASIQGTALSTAAVYVEFSGGYDKYSFGIPSVPFGSRTVKAHDDTNCRPDQTQNLTVGPGTNTLPSPFIFSPFVAAPTVC